MTTWTVPAKLSAWPQLISQPWSRSRSKWRCTAFDCSCLKADSSCRWHNSCVYCTKPSWAACTHNCSRDCSSAPSTLTLVFVHHLITQAWSMQWRHSEASSTPSLPAVPDPPGPPEPTQSTEAVAPLPLPRAEVEDPALGALATQGRSQIFAGGWKNCVSLALSIEVFDTDIWLCIEISERENGELC